jgi:hypothetical protein
MLIMRQMHQTEGRLCQDCLGRAYRKHQLCNLFLGWWGMISFVLTFVFLIENTRQYFVARSELKRMVDRKEGSRFVPQGSPGEILAPFRHNVRLRLRREETPAAIAADLAATHQVPLDDATAFVSSIATEAATSS